MATWAYFFATDRGGYLRESAVMLGHRVPSAPSPTHEADASRSSSFRMQSSRATFTLSKLSMTISARFS